MYIYAHPVKLPGEDAVDLCLSFTSAGMSEHEALPFASENKSEPFWSISGQLHLLHSFVVVAMSKCYFLPNGHLL